MFEKFDYTVEGAPDTEQKPEPPTDSAPKKTKKKAKPQRPVKATIIESHGNRLGMVSRPVPHWLTQIFTHLYSNRRKKINVQRTILNSN